MITPLKLEYARSRAEYEAWRWTWNYISKFPIYDVKERYNRWRLKYIANGGTPND
jgi:hypothetical protein